MLRSIKVAALCGLLVGSINVFADDHASASNPVAAMQLHVCSLNDGKDMTDVNKALAPWRKWKEETQYNGWTAQLTPQFDIRDGADFYWLNFAPFDYMAEVLSNYAETGAAVQRSVDSVASCKTALYASKLKFPAVEESNLNSTSVVSVESCNRKEGVEISTITARHALFSEASAASGADYIWNIVWPLAGIPAVSPTGVERADFAHMFWFPDLASQMAAYDSEVNGEIGPMRRDYLQAYADCTDRNTFNVSILNKPTSAWR